MRRRCSAHQTWQSGRALLALVRSWYIVVKLLRNFEKTIRVESCHLAWFAERNLFLDFINGKAKSRWCVHGHTDPDLGRLSTYSPTPATESIMLFLQSALNSELRLSFADVKNAFCQSRRLNRAGGRLFAEPCEGLELPAGALIELVIPVYGLEDAPYEWRATVLDYLIKELNFIQNILEPCWLSKYDKKGHLQAQILVEVDDFIVAAKKKDLDQLKIDLEKRFHFGKWEWDSAEYAGRNIKSCGDRILIDQQKYIVENLHPIHLARGRRSEKQASLSTAEFESLRSLVYKINWLARETRPEVCGTASILASRLRHTPLWATL